MMKLFWWSGRPKKSTRRDKGVTVLYLDGKCLKFAHAKLSGNERTVTTLYSKLVEGLSNEEIVDSLRELYQAGEFTIEKVLIAHPSHLTTASMLAVPSSNENEIHEMVELQVEKETPHAKEETLSYHRLLDQNASGYSHVLVVLTHQEAVDKVVKLAHELKVGVDRVGSEIDGLTNWFRYCAKTEAPETTQDGTLVADIDADSTTLMIFKQGESYFHRSIPMGVHQIVGTEGAVDSSRFVGELRRSIETFEEEELDFNCTQAIVTGLAGQIPDLCDAMQSGLNLPTRSVSPFENCGLSDEVKEAQGGHHDTSFVSLLGLILAPSEGDLTPLTLKLQNAFRKRSKELVTLGCQFLMVLLLGSFILVGQAHKNLNYHAWLTQMSQTASQDVKQIGDAMDQVAAVEERLGMRGSLLEAK
jgi:Tfp pilus assembly PilM family ATPase